LRGTPPDLDTALERGRQALDGADRLGMRPIGALCHLTLGQVYEALQQGAEARRHLAAAAAVLQELEMPLWLPETEARLQALR
ncbi:MAG: hypothetical protein L0027_17185, partial [Candidatus Rokubacteria bacterium]|nr:hypothetical protein [Candidatus Rokubacteria bacterium]